VRAMVNHVNIMDAHRPERFEGDAVFFTAGRGRGPKSPTLDHWTGFVSGEIRNFDIDITHLRMADPEPLAEIGAILRDVLSAHTPIKTRS
jgi:thioesterase domain-containing protein